MVKNVSYNKYSPAKFRYLKKNYSDDEDNDFDDDHAWNDELYCCDCFCFRLPWLTLPNSWCVKDICGIICAFITWLLMIFAEFVVVFVFILPSPFTVGNFIHTIIFNILAFLALSSHSYAMLTDPGTIPLGNAQPELIEKLSLSNKIIYRCPKCISIKPLRAHHCSICKRCIKKMDHHCPWINNCVGEANQKYFVLFTLYIFLLSGHAILLIITHTINCLDNDWSNCSSFSPAATLIFIMVLGFESLLFGIFTLVMFCTQISAILSDETQIETLKNEETKWAKKSKMESLKSVFGSDLNICWLSPFHNPNSKLLLSSLNKLIDV